MSKKIEKYTFKTLCILIGCFINTFGLTLAIRAGFGASTFTVMLDGIAHTLSITIGQASWILSAAIFVFCLFYSRRQLSVGTVLVVVVNGFLLDFYSSILVYPASRIACFFIMIVGILIMGFGAAIMAFADFGRGAYEGLTFAFVDRNGWQVRYVRIVLDILLVAGGMALGGKAGLCTICTIPLCGPTIQATLKLLRRAFPKLAKL
ncbi:MAG: YitT family protein [Oscillospiraceae bacterium]|nr:YitT family protein [Oscillospiraceae bacterium]